jgi:hypothetical protein
MIIEGGAARWRSLWSATSLLALSNDLGRTKAGASSTHSKRFAQFGCGFAALHCYASICSQAAKVLEDELPRGAYGAPSLLALS